MVVDTGRMAPAVLWKQGLLPIGRALEQLDRMPQPVSNEVKAVAREAHARFWEGYGLERGDPEGRFYWVVGVFQLKRWVAQAMDLNPGDVVLDLASGSAPLASYCVDMVSNGELAGYFGVDIDSRLRPRSLSELQRLGLPGDVILHDLNRGIPVEELRSHLSTIRYRRLKAVVDWGLYFPMSTIVRLVEQVFEFGAESLVINQLTAGRFNPKVLALRFLPHLVWNVLLLRISPPRAIKALMGLPWMMGFGLEMKKLFPIWPVAEVMSTLRQAGFCVEVLDTALWKQTTLLRVTPN